ncbi:SMI1/KNR4 family protein [Winogradskyella sp. F6397]|uniref:SMI1/KNR4 family protein n=1 Tax=Winogradskyella marina TaxID=2785530 RepID=A0ABS0EGT7_9FLAO|nr:SMI1/KNR4 family protein [Winogradskyella marina]MBF8149627.1 SMI1/KNR4 family protein [Winogradskyella marina]
MEIFNKFRERFDKNDDLEKASESHIEKLKAELNIIIPNQVKLFLTEYGNIYSPEILDLIVDNEIDLWDIQEFWTTERIIYDKQNEWTAQLSVDLIPFASDSMGNIFGFLTAELNEEKQSCSVHFFDHDFNTVEKIANSFSEWIDQYNRI